jgi:hypothetical protein
MTAPGMHYLKDAIDCHVHACPHLNGRSVNIFEAVRQAAAAGMRAIGLMDNFCNSSGYAALAMAELGHLGVEVFGGVIMQPTAGGVTLEVARSALGYGYGPGTGARFVSLPTHHTRYIAEREGRSGAYLETTFQVPESGRIPDPVPAIMDLVAERDAVFDCGHVSGREAVALAQEARRRGVGRVRTHGSRYSPDEIKAIGAAGAFVEFSFFILTHATTVGLTHVDQEKHKVAGGMATIAEMAGRIRAAGRQAILSTDAGVFLLPPPVEAFREFMLLVESENFTPDEIRLMNTDNPARLFKVGAAPTDLRAAAGRYRGKTRSAQHRFLERPRPFKGMKPENSPAPVGVGARHLVGPLRVRPGRSARREARPLMPLSRHLQGRTPLRRCATSGRCTAWD